MAEVSCDSEDYSDLIELCREVPLQALQISARLTLVQSLGPTNTKNSNDVDDYERLAELALEGLKYPEIEEITKRENPIDHLLNVWIEHPEWNPTCDRLITFLLEIDRRDVVSRCRKLFENDVEMYKKDKPVTSSLNDGFQYDAFVIYNPEAKDLKFVKEMAAILEGPKYNIRLFIPWRDDEPGSHTPYEVTAEYIEKRCRRAIVILSTEFQNSPSVDFQFKYAHCLSIGAKQTKLIPIRIDQCDIPNIIQGVIVCDFYKESIREWVWPRLAKSLMVPLRNKYDVPTEKLRDITLDTSSEVTRKWWKVSLKK